ncbi:hypothetical protein HYW42_04680 [Candidatus Daviesbacteria bacterium]|nr:hypothetical protein [Candidatus Daviesbacteria bacterium]
MTKVNFNINEVIDYVRQNTVPSKTGFICVDGRYPAKYSGMLARPGGNFRGIMTLLALRKRLKLTIGKVVDKAVEAVERMGITFNMHTDSHANPDDLASIGCGHIAKAADPKTAQMYKVNPQDVKLALTYLRLKLEDRKYYSMVELEGSHKEKGVLVITGSKKTVNHYDSKSDQMYFVYDKTRDEEYTKKLWKNFQIKGLKFEEFKRYSDMQLNATLENLATGLPVYEVNADKKEPEVKLVGIVNNP